MGIQINGQTDTITAIDGGLNVSGADLGSASAGSLNVTGIVTASGFSGNVNSTGVSTFTNGINVGTGASISSPATNVLALGTNNSERVRVSAAGSFAVGTSAAISNLVTTGAPSTSWRPQLAFQNTNGSQAEAFVGSGNNAHNIWVTAGAEPSNDPDGSNWATARSTVAAIYRQRDASHRWYADTSLTSGNTYTPTERVRIDSSGRVTMPYQPYFYARPTTSGDGQTANPYTFANVIHNVGNHFVTSGTGAYQRFVAPIDGVYCFQTSPGYKQTSADWNIYFRINGIGYAEVGRFIGSPSSHSVCTGSITLKLNANDYVDVSNQGITYHINATFNFFCGYLLR